MRKLVSNVFNLLLAILLAAMGIALAAWIVLANYRVTEAFDWALWALELLPFSLNVPLVQLANEMTQRNSLIWVGVAAAYLCWVGFSNLRGEREDLRGAREVEILVDEGHSKSARVELRADHPRVGRPLEGALRLIDDSISGNRFRLVLSCSRVHWQDNKSFTETAFVEQQEVRVVRGGPGCSIPFRFNVPATAPPSSNTANPSGFQWHLAVHPLDTVFKLNCVFPLRLDPAPAEELRAIEARETPQQKEAIDGYARAAGLESLMPHQRAGLQALSPADFATALKGAGMPAKIVKWILIVFFGVPIVITGLVFAAAALLGQYFP